MLVGMGVLDRFRLDGKTALVTGGSRGLGRAMALAFARAGADVVIASRKLDACAAVAREIEALGRRALAHACHVGAWDELARLTEAAYTRFGRVDGCDRRGDPYGKIVGASDVYPGSCRGFCGRALLDVLANLVSESE